MNEAEETSASNLRLIGGRLCLDFANTLAWRGSNQPRELIDRYSELISWSRHAGILHDNEAQQLLHEAKLHPEEASAVLKRAITLRESIYSTFSAIADGLLPTSESLTILNKELSEAMIHLRIAPMSSGFAWTFEAKENKLDRMLWSITRSAADLLTSKEVKRVSKCSSKDCGWLFLDMSRNRTRRWCDMKDCGNRAKARRHYERTRAFI
jgi:predicted RNA-binding Zn ribbon-like protein